MSTFHQMLPLLVDRASPGEMGESRRAAASASSLICSPKTPKLLPQLQQNLCSNTPQRHRRTNCLLMLSDLFRQVYIATQHFHPTHMLTRMSSPVTVPYRAHHRHLLVDISTQNLLSKRILLPLLHPSLTALLLRTNPFSDSLPIPP